MRAWILCLMLVLAGCASVRTDKAVWTPELNAGEVDFAKALAHYGQGLIIEGDQQNSSSNTLAQFMAAAMLDTDSYRLQSRAAMEALLQGKADVAVSVLEKFCNENTGSFLAWIYLARAREFAGRHDGALSAYKHASTINPTNAFSYASMAGIAFRSGDDKSAISFIEDGLRYTDNKKGLLGICHNQAREFVVSDRLKRAIPCFEFLIKNSPADTSHYNYLLGEVYRRLKEPKKAMRSYYLASRQKNPLADSFIRLAILQQVTHPKKSVKTLERGRRQLPNNPLILLALSRAYRGAGLIDDFVDMYDEIIESIGKFKSEELRPEFYLTYASECDKLGRNDAAQRMLKDCINKYPDSADVLNHLSYMWAENGVEFDQALVYSKRAVALQPDNGAFADTLGWVYYKRNDYKNALKELVRANSIMGGNPEIINHLGDVEFALGNVTGAVSYWSKALILLPKNRELILKLMEQGVDIDDLLAKSEKGTKEK